jgi:hypothetical protein
MPISSHCRSRPKSGLDCQFSTTSKVAKLARQKNCQNEHSGLTTFADARLRRRDQPTFQFYDQPQDRNARDVLAKGRKHCVWTNANIREWLSRGKKRRKALETATITEPLPIARRHLDDDDAALTASP